MDLDLNRVEPGPDFTPEEYLGQSDVYWSSSAARYEKVRLQPCPHALRALAKLERKHGFDILTTPLARALKARAEQGIDADVTDVPTVTGEARMLRDRSNGQFRGAYRPSASKRRVR